MLLMLTRLLVKVMALTVSQQLRHINELYYTKFLPVCSYILWKTVAKHLPTPEQRTAFCSGVGEQLLQQLMPDVQQQLQAASQGARPACNPGHGRHWL
jgi:hypothetical protein